MNEFADQGHQPSGDPRARLVPARPASPPPPADPPVSVRIIWAAGIQSPVDKGLGEAEQDLFLSLASAPASADEVRGVQYNKVRGVQYRDFTLSPARDVFVLDSPALPQIAVDRIAGGINLLLGRPRLPDTLVPASPAFPGTVQVRIIWDARIQSPGTGRLGEGEGKLFLSLPDSVRANEVRGVQDNKVWGVRYRGFTLSAGGGFVLDSPALPQIAVGKFAGAINVWLRPPRRDSPREGLPPPVELPRPHGGMGPFD